MESININQSDLLNASEEIEEIVNDLLIVENLLEAPPNHVEPNEVVQRLPAVQDDGLDDDLDEDIELSLAILRASWDTIDRAHIVDRVVPLTFADVQYEVQPFSGDDVSLRIEDWVADYERVMDNFRAGNSIRYVYGRRLLTGSAGMFLYTVETWNWADLRRELLREFGHRENLH